MDLDQPIRLPAVGAAQCQSSPEQEGQVLAHIGPQPGALVALNVDPADLDSVELCERTVGGLAQGEDVHGATARHERLGLAPDARILFVVRVREHGYRTRRGALQRALPSPISSRRVGPSPHYPTAAATDGSRPECSSTAA